MIEIERFVKTLQSEGVEFFAGVPDSFLNGFCNYLLEVMPKDKHIITANEGNAIAMAAGYYFSTNTVPLVYMQNSGIGNALNPLASLVDKYVYSVPMVLLIGWRGEPGTELKHPQHKTQGAITLNTLDILSIPYFIAEDDDSKLSEQTKQAVRTARKEKKPFAIIGRKGVFAGEKKTNLKDESYPLSREEAIEIILNAMPKDTIYTATTGRATRELYFLRERRNEGHQFDFLNLGSMGHASSVALGIAVANQNRKVVCLDGDSSALMHMGFFTMASKLSVPNFLHIVLNNGAHESVGGQPSAGHLVDFTKIADGSGYFTVGSPIVDKESLVSAINETSNAGKASFIDVRIHKGLNGVLPSLEISSEKLIQDFMKELKSKN